MALRVSNVDLAKLLGCSRRTIQRWLGGESSIMDTTLVDLARLVFPRDPALAEEMAHNAGVTLVNAGIVPPPPPPEPPAPPAPLAAAPPRPLAQLAHAVVCVAAETMNLSPKELRPTLHAAFKCARELGLAVEEVEQGLAPRPSPARATMK
jgi:hypothetical protein